MNPFDEIRLLTDKRELSGTCYFEFLPGGYAGRCWNETSVFLSEAAFGLIEPVFRRNEPAFDHYGFIPIARENWRLILADLSGIATAVLAARSVEDFPDSIGFLFKSSRRRFSTDFTANAGNLATLCESLSAWVDERLVTFDTITVLGI